MFTVGNLLTVDLVFLLIRQKLENVILVTTFCYRVKFNNLPRFSLEISLFDNCFLHVIVMIRYSRINNATL